jgi:hypothetical protein
MEEFAKTHRIKTYKTQYENTVFKQITHKERNEFTMFLEFLDLKVADHDIKKLYKY